ncbi:hypothetical protein JK222_15715 [Gluconobacter cerinus]|uniref:hypothetical protein n=1 Tax=Gluconobacter cerinus TaxID=38307 RepID=UPI001B8B57E6|nr:hypothetical protein [Gluconobacter cerinus]MBS1073119.1 hypothetical protein [Gluconobacter cerinus]
MTFRTIGIDLAIRGDHLAQIYDDGRPNGRAIRFRHDQPSLAAFVQTAVMGLRADDHIQAIMEPTGMSWFPVAHHPSCRCWRHRGSRQGKTGQSSTPLPFRTRQNGYG